MPSSPLSFSLLQMQHILNQQAAPIVGNPEQRRVLEAKRAEDSEAAWRLERVVNDLCALIKEEQVKIQLWHAQLGELENDVEFMRKCSSKCEVSSRKDPQEWEGRCRFDWIWGTNCYLQGVARLTRICASPSRNPPLIPPSPPPSLPHTPQDHDDQLKTLVASLRTCIAKSQSALGSMQQELMQGQVARACLEGQLGMAHAQVMQYAQQSAMTAGQCIALQQHCQQLEYQAQASFSSRSNSRSPSRSPSPSPTPSARRETKAERAAREREHLLQERLALQTNRSLMISPATPEMRAASAARKLANAAAAAAALADAKAAIEAAKPKPKVETPEEKEARETRELEERERHAVEIKARRERHERDMAILQSQAARRGKFAKPGAPRPPSLPATPRMMVQRVRTMPNGRATEAAEEWVRRLPSGSSGGSGSGSGSGSMGQGCPDFHGEVSLIGYANGMNVLSCLSAFIHCLEFVPHKLSLTLSSPPCACTPGAPGWRQQQHP
jgi:hypothetical protein